MSVDEPRDAQRAIGRLTRRSFVAGTIGAAAGLGGLGWIATRAPDEGVPWPLRRVLDWNARLASALYRPTRLAPTYPVERAEDLRVNQHIGLKSRLNMADYQVRVTFLDVRPAQELPLAAIFDLPKVELVTELRCVEGWSQIVHWGGARFADFAARYGGASPYVGLATPDGQYAVSFDFASAMHPQTLLVWEMNGQPLTSDHGAPLRLVAPTKYGWKSIKRIGTIAFTQTRPRDYWVERGYDWYAGL